MKDRLRAEIAAQGTNMKQVSLDAGLGETYVRDLLTRRGGAKVEQLRAIARALRKPDNWLIDEPQGGADGGVYRPVPDFLGERDLPVYAAVEGGSGEMVVSTDAVEMVPRPWFLKAVRDGYAVIVTGESMVPAFEPGDMAIVNPRLPAIRGKHAIFVAGEEHGEFRATIKRLVASTAENWKAEQYNPPPGAKREVILPKRTWAKALRVVGKYEGG